MFAFVDPAGVFFVFDFFTARTLMASRAAIVAVSDMILILYCHDTYKTFSGSQLRRHVPFLVKHWWALPLVIFIGLTMVICDLVVSHLSLSGVTTGASSLIPVIYLLVLYLIGSIWLLRLSFLVKSAVTKKLTRANGAPLEGPLRETIERTLLMRKYMIVSTMGRIGNMFGFVMVAFDFYSMSPELYMLVMGILFSFCSLVSSTAQILLAIEVTPTTRSIGSIMASTAAASAVAAAVGGGTAAAGMGGGDERAAVISPAAHVSAGGTMISTRTAATDTPPLATAAGTADPPVVGTGTGTGDRTK